MRLSLSKCSNAVVVTQLLRFLLISLPTGIVAAYSLDGKRVLVTGSSGGIGKGIALELAKHGAKVIVHYNERHEGALQTKQELGDHCIGVLQCDFRKPETIPSFMDQVQQCCRDYSDDDKDCCLDVLVNNAGIVAKLALEDDTDELSIWHETLAVNLHAPNMLSRLAMEEMKKKVDGRGSGGVIINVSSIHGERSNEYMGAYAASKAALDSLTRTMAIEYAPYNIRVNAIAPGVVPVERTFQAFQNPDIMNSWTERIPLDKVGTVEEVAMTCIPLITNEWITGTIWTVDGGMMARAHMPERDRPPVPPP